MVYCLTMKFYACLFPENLAINKRSTQIGTHKGRGPQFANDGNLDQGPWNRVCSWSDSRGSDADNPESGESAWWSVDLASHDPSQRFVVMSVSIYFCIPRCHCMYLIRLKIAT